MHGGAVTITCCCEKCQGVEVNAAKARDVFGIVAWVEVLQEPLGDKAFGTYVVLSTSSSDGGFGTWQMRHRLFSDIAGPAHAAGPEGTANSRACRAGRRDVRFWPEADIGP